VDAILAVLKIRELCCAEDHSALVVDDIRPSVTGAAHGELVRAGSRRIDDVHVLKPNIHVTNTYTSSPPPFPKLFTLPPENPASHTQRTI